MYTAKRLFIALVVVMGLLAWAIFNALAFKGVR